MRFGTILTVLTVLTLASCGILFLNEESDESSALTDGDWTFVVENGSAVLTKYNGNNANSIVIPNTVTDGVSTYIVTSIRGVSSSNPAVSNTSLNQNCTLTLSTSLRSIGDYAFTGCDRFTGSITIPDTSSTIDTILSIGESAFEGCSGFNGSISLYQVRSIDDYAFKDCSGLIGNLTLPNSVDTLGNGAFYGCSSLTSLVFPNYPTLTSIGDYAFYGCSGLTGSLTFPNSVTLIGTSAFEGCSGFTGTLTLSTSLTTLYPSAFSNCGFTGTLTLPTTLTSLGTGVFSGCSGFTGALVIPSGITAISDSAFTMCSGITSVSFPDTLTAIGVYAFSNSGITQLFLPDSITTIGMYAFFNCSGISGNVGIPSSVTSLAPSTFYGCSGITSVVLNKNLASIGSSAFNGCTSLATVYNASSLTLTTGSTDNGYVAYYANQIYTCYTITVQPNQNGWGTVTDSSIVAVSGEYIGVSNNRISTTVPGQDSLAFAETDYQFDGWDNTSGAVNSDRVVTATFSKYIFTVSFVPNDADWGSISKSSIKVSKNTSIQVNSNVLQFGTEYVSATPANATVQYVYAFGSWSGLTSTVTTDMTITANFTRSLNVCTVTVQSSNLAYGDVDTHSFTVVYGSAISVNGQNLTIDGTTVTATPTQSDAQTTYAFANWSPSSGTITQATTITANFDMYPTPYLVYFDVYESGWGTVSESVLSVGYGTVPSVSYMTITFGSDTVSASVTPATMQYTYGWDGWTGVPASITQDTHITANFTRTLTRHSVNFSVNDTDWGNVNSSTILVDYGTVYSSSGNEFYIDGLTVTATPEIDTAEWDYEFVSWSPSSGTISAPTTINVTFSRTLQEYVVTIAPNDVTYGDVDIHSVTVPYGTSYSSSGVRMTVGTTQITATAESPTSQYIYDFYEWSPSSGTVSGPTTITAVFTQVLHQYTVYIVSNDPDWGTVDINSLTVNYGAVYSSNGDTLTLDGVNIYASPRSATSQYTYGFQEWSPSSGTVSGPTTITAVFTRTLNYYTVSIVPNDANYGSVSSSTVSVPYNSAITVAGNLVHIGEYTITATPTPQTAEYNYFFVNWTCSTYTVTGDGASVMANFNRALRSYTVYFTSDEPTWGSVDTYHITVDYGAHVSAIGNTLYVASDTIVATPANDTAQYDYEFDHWSQNSGTITGETVIFAYFTRTTLAYTVTIGTSNPLWGTVSPHTVLVPYGTPVSAIGNELTIGSDTIIATPSADTAMYHYAFDNWSQDSGYITGTTLITATFTRTTIGFVVTFQSNDISMGTVNVASVIVPNGTSVSADGNILTVGSTEVTATPQDDTAQYLFAFDNWSQDSGTITDTTTITANFTRTLRSYTVTISTNNAEYGTVSIDTISADYGTPISAHGTTLTVGSISSVASETEDTAQYTYTFVRWEGVVPSVSGDCTITANFTRTLNHYTVSFTVAQGCGTWSVDTMNVAYGTAISLADMTVTVGDRTSVFTKTPDTESKAYVLDSLTIPVSVIESDLTVHADVSEYNQIPAFNIIQPQYEGGDVEPKDGPAWSLLLVIPILVIVGLIITASRFMRNRGEYDEF